MDNGAKDTSFGNVVKCGYANAVATAATAITGELCTAAADEKYTWRSGAVGTANLAAQARRGGTKVTTTLSLDSSIISGTAMKTAGALVTAASATTAIKAVNTASGANFTDAKMTVSKLNTIKWSTSDASAVVPSMMAGVVALFLSLMH